MHLSKFLSLSPLVAVAAADHVWQCQTIGYADGYLYCRKNAQGQCLGDLGDFPAKDKFVLNSKSRQQQHPYHHSLTKRQEKETDHAKNIAAVAVGDNPDRPMDPIRLADQVDFHRYNVFDQRLYLDSSPGAFTPMGFTRDNSTLRGGETTWGFFGAQGFLIWSATGRIADAGPPAKGGGTQVVAQQGFDWVESDWPGVYQLYWNQTQWEEAVRGRYNLQAGFFGQCYGDYSPVMTDVS